MMIIFAVGQIMAFMLIALGIGYLIVIKGDKEKGFLRALGLVLGFFIVVMSFFMVLLFTNIMRIDREMSLTGGPRMRQMAPMPMHPKMMMK